MATYLIVRNGDNVKSYRCSSTHTNKPYIQVKENCYLDLTTETSSGLQLNAKLSKRTDTFITTTGYKGYFSCRQSTASGIKSSNGSTYSTTDYEPFVSFTSTAGWATRNTTYTRTSHNIGVLSSASALTTTSSIFNKGIYRPVQSISSITDISSQSQVDYTIQTTTSSSTGNSYIYGYSGRSTFNTITTQTTGYNGRTSSRRTTGSGYRSTTGSEYRTNTYGYSGYRASNYTQTTGYNGYHTYNTTTATIKTGFTKTSSRVISKFTLYGGGGRNSTGGNKSGSASASSNTTYTRTSSSQKTGKGATSPAIYLWYNGATSTKIYTGTSHPSNSTWAQITGRTHSSQYYTTTSINANSYRVGTSRSSLSSPSVGNLLSTTARTANYTRASYTSSYAAGGLYATTALTERYTIQVSSRYATTDYYDWYPDFTSTISGTQMISGTISSTAVGNMYSTTARILTGGRTSSVYKSSTTIGVLLSTTALTSSTSSSMSTSTSRSSSSYSQYTFLTSTSVLYT